MNFITKYQFNFLQLNIKSNVYKRLIINSPILSNGKNFNLMNINNRNLHICVCQNALSIAVTKQHKLLKHHVSSTNQIRNYTNTWLDDLAIFQMKYFQMISQSSIVETSMNGLQYVHDSLHIPWWLSIVISTVILRTAITFPLAIYQNYILAKLENLRPEMDALVKELKRETAIAIKMYNWDTKKARMMYNRSARRIWKELIIKENCHPVKASLLIIFQIPLWIILSFSYRNMTNMLPHQDAHAQLVFLELSNGGFGWLPNLTDIDHSLILPVMMCLCNILIVDVNSAARIVAETKRHKYITYFLKSVSIIILPIAANVPGCLILYWTTSSFCGLVQNLAIMSPRLRRTFGIPQTPSESPNPYKRLADTLQKRYLFKKENKY